jgi:hypothetical protein
MMWTPAASGQASVQQVMFFEEFPADAVFAVL